MNIKRLSLIVLFQLAFLLFTFGQVVNLNYLFKKVLEIK